MVNPEILRELARKELAETVSHRLHNSLFMENMCDRIVKECSDGMSFEDRLKIYHEELDKIGFPKAEEKK